MSFNLNLHESIDFLHNLFWDSKACIYWIYYLFTRRSNSPSSVPSVHPCFVNFLRTPGETAGCWDESFTYQRPTSDVLNRRFPVQLWSSVWHVSTNFWSLQSGFFLVRFVVFGQQGRYVCDFCWNDRVVVPHYTLWQSSPFSAQCTAWLDSGVVWKTTQCAGWKGSARNCAGQQEIMKQFCPLYTSFHFDLTPEGIRLRLILFWKFGQELCCSAFVEVALQSGEKG